MKTLNWHGSAWWIDPALWASEPGYPHRPTEDEALGRIRQEATRRRRPLLQVIVALERWYHDCHPQVIPFVRLQLIARRLDMSVYQVADALTEASRLIEAGAL
jgi:hypothetical protein